MGNENIRYYIIERIPLLYRKKGVGFAIFDNQTDYEIHLKEAKKTEDPIIIHRIFKDERKPIDVARWLVSELEESVRENFHIGEFVGGGAIIETEIEKGMGGMKIFVRKLKDK